MGNRKLIAQNADSTAANYNPEFVSIAKTAGWINNDDDYFTDDDVKSVTALGNYFKNNTNIEEIDLSEFSALTDIDSSAFENCTKLDKIIFPANVNLGNGRKALSGCTSLTDVILPNNATEIPAEFFSGCTSLEEVTIPESVESIGNYAFSGCTSLKKVTWLTTETDISNLIIGNQIFRNTTQNISVKISSELYNAIIAADNGEGTIDWGNENVLIEQTQE